MTAYVISELSDIRPEFIGAYLAAARPSIEAHGGRYLTSTTAIDLLEGDDAPKRFVIVEFGSMDQARRWYRSPEYEAALAIRPKALTRRLMIVDGEVD